CHAHDAVVLRREQARDDQPGSPAERLAGPLRRRRPGDAAQERAIKGPSLNVGTGPRPFENHRYVTHSDPDAPTLRRRPSRPRTPAPVPRAPPRAGGAQPASAVSRVSRQGVSRRPGGWSPPRVGVTPRGAITRSVLQGWAGHHIPPVGTRWAIRPQGLHTIRTSRS